MAIATFEGVKITGMACAVPTHVDSIYNFVDLYGEEHVEKFIATTGVRERRRVHKKQTCSDLCCEAAEKLIAHKGYDKDSFDALFLVTQSPDYGTPATSHILQMRLGLSTDCAVFDVNLGCSGFVYAVNMAATMVKSGAYKRVLFCCGDAFVDHGLTDEDKATSMLFGDSGSAMILEKGDDTIHTLLKADGEGYQAIFSPGLGARVEVDLRDLENLNVDLFRGKMDGSAVFEFAITKVPRSFKEFFKTFGGTIDDYDYCVFHQANLFMLEHICKKIKLPREKMPVSMDRYGNTSSVSIPLTITDLIEREDCPEKIRFISAGFGIGLSWGVADFVMDKNDILPVIETDSYFEDAFTG